jgi:hypothetical protein
MEEKNLSTQQVNNELVPTAPKKRAAPVRKAPVVIKDLKEELPKPLTLQEMRQQKAEEARLRLRREWEVESQMVTGVFRDLEVGPGGNLRFSARKYPWDQTSSYNFVDGQTYTVPLWVDRHLNENCKWPAYRHNIDPNAKEGEKVQQIIGQWNHRFAFVSSDFIGLSKPSAPNIIMVGNE